MEDMELGQTLGRLEAGLDAVLKKLDAICQANTERFKGVDTKMEESLKLGYDNREEIRFWKRVGGGLSAVFASLFGWLISK
jgi:hypothetical protein